MQTTFRRWPNVILNKKRGCYKRLILLIMRRTILTEKRRKSVKSVFKEEVLEKWNRFLCWGVDCVNWSTASPSQAIQTLCNNCIGFEIGFHSDDINSSGPSKGVWLSPSSFSFFDKVLLKMSKSIANMIPIEQIIWQIKHALLINDWRCTSLTRQLVHEFLADEDRLHGYANHKTAIILLYSNHSCWCLIF